MMDVLAGALLTKPPLELRSRPRRGVHLPTEKLGPSRGLTLVRPQRFATYMVISMPKRSSMALGVSHFIYMSFHAGSD